MLDRWIFAKKMFAREDRLLQKRKKYGGRRAHFRYVGHSEDHGFLEALAKVVKYSSSKSINSTQLSSRPFCSIIHMDY